MDSKEAVQHNEQTTEQKLNKETDDNPQSWREELVEEIKQIVEQSEKHAAKADIEEANQERDLNEKDIKDTGKGMEGENSHEVPPGDPVQNIEDVDGAEFSSVHVVDEKQKEDVSKSSEILESSKQSDYIETAENSDSGEKKPGNDDSSNKDNQKVEEADMAEKSIDDQQQQQPTETLNKKDQEDGGKIQAGEERRGEEVKTGQYDKKSKAKAKAKKGRGRKKVTERDAMDEWDGDDYDDIDSYDEGFDDEVDDDEIEDFYEDPDSIESWKMSEKPLDEAEELSDEDVSKIKEDLQEEIKQLKGFISFFFLLLYFCSNPLGFCYTVTCFLVACHCAFDMLLLLFSEA